MEELLYIILSVSCTVTIFNFGAAFVEGWRHGWTGKG